MPEFVERVGTVSRLYMTRVRSNCLTRDIAPYTILRAVRRLTAGNYPRYLDAK